MRAYDDRFLTTRPGSAHADAWLSPVKPDQDCCLTSRDYTLLEALLYQLTEAQEGTDPLLLRLIRGKLANARVVLSADVEPDIATGNSRIAFSIDGADGITRVLTHWEDGHRGSDTLPVRSLLGATLLGMRVGQQSPLPRDGAPSGIVALQKVLVQPEATRIRSRMEVRNG